MFLFVQLWKSFDQSAPSVQERVQATSEADALVKVMRKYHLFAVDRAWVGHTAKIPPTVRLINVYVKGSKRFWRGEPAFMTPPPGASCPAS